MACSRNKGDFGGGGDEDEEAGDEEHEQTSGCENGNGNKNRNEDDKLKQERERERKRERKQERERNGNENENGDENNEKTNKSRNAGTLSCSQVQGAPAVVVFLGHVHAGQLVPGVEGMLTEGCSLQGNSEYMHEYSTVSRLRWMNKRVLLNTAL